VRIASALQACSFSIACVVLLHHDNDGRDATSQGNGHPVLDIDGEASQRPAAQHLRIRWHF